MIACDTSTLIDFLAGVQRGDVDRLTLALSERILILPPVVVTELLSFPKNDRSVTAFVRELPTLPLTDGYWARAGENQRQLLSKKLKARTADALIAQACIDADVPLIARDDDFRHFATHCGLKLA